MSEDDRMLHLQSEGWKVRTLSGFIEIAGPLWTRCEDDGWAYGFLLDSQHLNPYGTAHGGVLLTLLDHTMSAVAWEATDRSACVSLQFDAHFLAPVREGQFVKARAYILHRSRQLIFMRGSVTVGENVVLTAQAIMKVVSTAPNG